MHYKTIGLAAALLTSLGTAAMAAPFGAATASLGSFDVPTVTLDTVHGTGTVKLNGGPAQLSGGTGDLGATPYTGSGAGTLAFSMTAGVTTADVVTSLFTFSDNHGGSFVFNLATVTTISYTSPPPAAYTIALYLLGTFSEVNSNPLYSKSATATSLTMTFNQSGSSAYSESGSLSSPPTTLAPVPTPEPATLALMGVGLTAVGVIRRRRKTA